MHRACIFSETPASSQLRKGKNQPEPRSKISPVNCIFSLVKIEQNDTDQLRMDWKKDSA